EDGIRDFHVTGVQTCALPIWQRALGRLAVWRHADLAVRLEAQRVREIDAQSRSVDRARRRRCAAEDDDDGQAGTALRFVADSRAAAGSGLVRPTAAAFS